MEDAIIDVIKEEVMMESRKSTEDAERKEKKRDAILSPDAFRNGKRDATNG